MKKGILNYNTNSQVFLILNCFDEQLPNKQEDTMRRMNAEIIIKALPYLLVQERRIRFDIKLSFIQRFMYGSQYSFQKVKDGEGVEWIDYKINLMALLFSLCRIESSLAFNEVIEKYCRILPDDERTIQEPNECRVHLNWQKVIDQYNAEGKSDFYRLVNVPNHTMSLVDLFDKSYDEIKLTYLHSASYHRLFNWFGEATIEIGYRAFDLYTVNRNSESAWITAIKEHLETYRLSEELYQNILKEQIYPILKFK